MRTTHLSPRRLLFLTALLLLLTAGPTFAGGVTITIINNNAPGVGFNDPTPVAPVGGNTGTTLGQQRLNAFQHAAELWGQTLDGLVPVIVRAQFIPLAPNVLGSAGATFVFRDFGSVGFYPGEEFAATWYGSALADKRAGAELNSTPGFPDINASFSTNFNFYLGLDGNHGAQVDLVTVVLHELGHGLNFQCFVNGATGANFLGFTDIYARHLVDASTGRHWHEMTDAERQASAIKFGQLVWDGANVSAGIPDVLLFGSPEVEVIAPAAISRQYQFGTAAFGPPIGTPNVSGAVVAAEDPADVAGPATNDGCSPFTNAAAIAGNIALIERGTCGFALKARNASEAGASAVMIYNNLANAGLGPPGMATDPINGPLVTVPSISLNRPDGLAIVGELGSGVTASIGLDPTIRAGADELGRARLYAASLFAPGSSVSHYDTVARRNLLMEPAINADLTHNVKAPDDLTLELFRDIGWFADADLDGVADQTDCNPQSDLTATIVIGGTDTNVPNTLFSSGCTISDLIAEIRATTSNQGQFLAGVAMLMNSLVNSGLITQAQMDTVMAAVAHAKKT
jgi:hypothetical protein